MQRFKLCLLILSALLSFTISCSQNIQFDPDIEEYADLHPIKMDDGRYLFSWKDNYKSIKSIYLIANLPGKKKIQMVDLNGDGIYRCALDLPPATYYYKFLINKNLLVIPQHEDKFSRRMGNSGKLSVPDESKPFVSRVIPKHGKLVTKLNSLRFKISGNRKKLDLSRLRIYINGKNIRYNSKKPYKYDPKTGWCEITSFNKNWGAKTIKITGADKKNKKLFKAEATIYLYPNENKKEQKKTLQGVTGYQLLVPYFNSQDEITATLKTLLAKINYLNSTKKDEKEALGIKLLILHSLMPAEDSYHRITKSYNSFDRKIANNYLLKQVATECRKRGIKLITHYNCGYMSNGNPLFQAAYGNPVAFQKDWFYLDENATKYQNFLDNPNKPLLNLNNNYAANSFIKNIITWLKRGFNGFYFEKVGLQANSWWKRVRRTLPYSLLIAETTGGSDYKKQIFKNKFNILDDLQFSKQLLLAFSGNNPRKISDFIRANSHSTSTYGNLIHLSSRNDGLRPATILNNTTRLEAMLGFLLTSGGIPVLNWGDELGSKSRKAPLAYEPIKMNWKKVAKSEKNPLSLLNMIKRLTSLRLQYEELNREIKYKKSVITWAKKTAPQWSAFLRSTVKQRFFIGITAFEPTDDKISPIFQSKLNLANGIFIGKDLLRPRAKEYKITIKNGKIFKLQLPLNKRGFNLFLFEKKKN